jgi:hypothetical protein
MREQLLQFHKTFFKYGQDKEVYTKSANKDITISFDGHELKLPFNADTHSELSTMIMGLLQEAGHSAYEQFYFRNTLMNMLIMKGWDFSVEHDADDEQFIYLILGNREYFIYTENEAHDLITTIIEYY